MTDYHPKTTEKDNLSNFKWKINGKKMLKTFFGDKMIF
jgi:hypothetical protein